MGYTAPTITQDILHLELLALFKGLQLAMEHNLKHLEINVDAEQLITLLNSIDTKAKSYILLFDCRFLFQQLSNSTLIHIYREQNRLVDSLARRVISTAHPSIIATTSATTTITFGCLLRTC